MLTTINAIAADIIESRLSEEALITLRGFSLEQALFTHHGFGTWIRNEYRLWSDNPLTANWRTDSTSRDVRSDGVDYSADHPDNVSSEIIKAVWHLLQK